MRRFAGSDLRVRPLLLCLLATLVLLAAGAAVPALAQGPQSVAALARALSDAVVNISTTRQVGSRGVPFPQAPEGSPLQDFFNDRNPNRGLGQEALREARSLGSGFVIDPSGVIVTNNHVIDEASEIVVFLADGTRLQARVLGADDRTDVAVLKVDAGRPLTSVAFGDSDSAEVGDWVMAIGNPFGLGGSVTLGIVSARNRNMNTGPYDDFIQTDAAINEGNSGGPLFDMDGHVVGINTAIISRTGGGLGIGFAVPSNLAKHVADQLALLGETRRGWLGVGIQEVTDDIAASLGRTNSKGALVVDVTLGGPAEGVLEDGDLIVEFDGRPIDQMRDLPRIVALTDVGKFVQLRVVREGEEKVLAVTLGRLDVSEDVAVAPAVPRATPEGDEPQFSSLTALVGLEALPLDARLRAEFGLAQPGEGLVIVSVEDGSDAEAKGLIPGLLIEEINQRKVSTPDELAAVISASREAGRPAVLFRIADASGTRRFIAVRLE